MILLSCRVDPGRCARGVVGPRSCGRRPSAPVHLAPYYDRACRPSRGFIRSSTRILSVWTESLSFSTRTVFVGVVVSPLDLPFFSSGPSALFALSVCRRFAAPLRRFRARSPAGHPHRRRPTGCRSTCALARSPGRYRHGLAAVRIHPLRHDEDIMPLAVSNLGRAVPHQPPRPSCTGDVGFQETRSGAQRSTYRLRVAHVQRAQGTGSFPPFTRFQCSPLKSQSASTASSSSHVASRHASK